MDRRIGTTSKAITRAAIWARRGILVCAVVVGLFWITYRSITQDKRDHALVEAAEQNNLRDVICALHSGADPNAHEVYTNPVQSLVDAWHWMLHDKHIFCHEAPLIVVMAGYGGDQGTYQPIVQALLDAGADVNARDSFGRTALMDAAGADCPAMVRLLLEHGADKNIRNPRGQTALTEALKDHNTQVVMILQNYK